MNNIEKLNQKSNKLHKTLYVLRHKIEAHKILTINARAINTRGTGRNFFALVQYLLVESFAIDIQKIFEKEHRYPLDSILGILSFIEKNNIEHQYFDPIFEFINKYGKPSEQTEYINDIRTICNSFLEKHKLSFKHYDYVRDKVIAHLEEGASFKTLPSYDAIQEILTFGIDFHRMINLAFFNAEPHDIKNNESLSYSLYRVLRILGYTPKKDFDKT